VQVTRIADAPMYEAPGHYGMAALRLQGHGTTDSGLFWVGLSHFLPGGGAERSASSLDRVYIVIDGEVTLTTDADEATLVHLDSCFVAAGETRTVENRTALPASMLVIMPYPPDTDAPAVAQVVGTS
jgi:glyoxylate utilization-related uncharacterized protein